MKIVLLLTILTLNFKFSVSQSFINPSFEDWGNAGVCEVNVPPDGWSNYSNGAGGIAVDEAKIILCSFTIPPGASSGNTYARSSSRTTTAGEGLYQNVTGFTPGSSYTISFDYAGSDLYQGLNYNQWHVFADDTDISQSPVFLSTSAIWSTHTFTFIATNTTHKIGFRAYTTTNSDNGSAAIDNIRFLNPEGIHDNGDASQFIIHPIPFNETLHLQTEISGELDFVLFDVRAMKIMQRSFMNATRIDTKDIPAGFYFYMLKSNGRIIKKGSIIK